MQTASRGRQRVVDPVALPARPNEPRLPEPSHVAGHAGLGHGQHVHEFAHAPLSLPQEGQESEAVGIGEGFEEGRGANQEGRNHMRVSEYKRGPL